VIDPDDPTKTARHLAILRRTRARFVERFCEGDESVKFIDRVIHNIEAGADSVQALVAPPARFDREDGWV
jgi:hypothetical protein